MENWGRAALIGSSGFVGGALMGQIGFAAAFNSATIGTIGGQTFDTVVCAGAPGEMWRANADPGRDEGNLAVLARALMSARIGRLILISTTAVYADPSRGDIEEDGVFEAEKAYGRNRRTLELVMRNTCQTQIVRLPGLFGPGLKKNFLFDILHPTPAFLSQPRFQALCSRLEEPEAIMLARVFDWDAGGGLHVLNRGSLTADPHRDVLDDAFLRLGLEARRFSNSDSEVQYYPLKRLGEDLARIAEAGVDEINLVTEAWRLGDLHMAMVGEEFINTDPPVMREAVRTLHANLFGRSGSWRLSASEVLSELQAWFAEARA